MTTAWSEPDELWAAELRAANSEASTTSGSLEPKELLVEQAMNNYSSNNLPLRPRNQRLYLLLAKARVVRIRCAFRARSRVEGCRTMRSPEGCVLVPVLHRFCGSNPETYGTPDISANA